MDARWILACATIALTGCNWLKPPPSARPESRQEPTTEPPQVVADAERSADVDPAVQAYVERVERATPPPDDHPGAEPSDWAALAPDAVDGPAAHAHDDSPQGVEFIPDDPAGDDTGPGDESKTGEPDPETTREPPLEPPALEAVEVRAAPPPTAGEITPNQPDRPGVNTPAAARNAPTSLAEFLAQWPAPDEGEFRAQLDRRLMWVIAGDFERARQPLDLVTAEQAELAARLVETLIAIRGWHAGDQAAAAQAALGELERLTASLRKLSAPSIPVLEICSAVHGFGQYDALQPPRFLAGRASEFVLYCEVRDFVSAQDDAASYRSEFDLTTTIFNRSGDAVLTLEDRGIVDRCRNRRHDCFIPRLVRLPATLSPGSYVAKVTVVDKLAAKVAENSTTFEIVATR